MVALGAVDAEGGLGLEASGVVRRAGQNVKHLQPGDAVSVLATGLYTSRFVTSSKMCFPIASWITLEDAATIPVAYGTAIYSLLMAGQLERGQVRDLNNYLTINRTHTNEGALVGSYPLSMWCSWASGDSCCPNDEG